MADAVPNDSTQQQTRDAVAAEIRAELSRRKQSQRDVAAILGIPQSAVNLRLQGQRAFRAEELVMLAEAWGIPVSKLLPPTEVGAA